MNKTASDIQYKEIITKLKTARRKETILQNVSGWFNTLSITLSFVLLISLLEMLANGDSTFRTVLAFLILGIFFGAFIVMVFPEILRALGIRNFPDINSMALRVGDIYPEIKDRLGNALQLFSIDEKSYKTSKELAKAEFVNIYNSTSSKDFDKIIKTDKLKKSLVYFVSIFVLTVSLFALFSSGLGAAFVRIANFEKSYLPPAPFSLTIEPKNVSVVKGESVKIVVHATGKAPETVSLYIKEEQQQNYDVLTLRLDSSKKYLYELPSIKHSITFYAEAAWLNSAVKTEECKITVTDKPLIRSLSGKIIFPSYTKLSVKNIDEQSADISALRGSVAEFQLLSNKELSSGRIIFEKISSFSEISNDTAKKSEQIIIPLKTDGRRANGSMNINANGQYYFELTDKDGQKTDNPIKYTIIATNDEYPSIALLQPTTDVQLSEEAQMPMRIGITDDYGFSGLKLNYRLIHSKYSAPSEKWVTVNIPFLNAEKAIEVPYLWDLNKIDITPEDKYEYYLEVFDNDKISGPKSAKTQVLTVRLPSMDEVLQSAEDVQKKAEKDLEKILKQAEETKKDMEQLNRDLLKNQQQKNLDWKEKKKTEDILKKQADLQSKFNDIKQSLEEMTKKLEQNNLLSPETLQKYQELQKLMQEVQSPELKKLQEAMKQAMDKLSPDELQKAMKNYKFNEEQFRKSIERTLKILKRLQAEQKVDALNKRAEELSKKQDELNKKLQNSNPSDKSKRDDLSKEQKGAKEDLKKMGDDLKDLEKLMKDIGDNMPMNEMEKAQSELNQDETSDAMQDAKESTEKGDFQKADNSQKKASKNLKKFAQQMKKLKDEMDNRNKKEAQRKLQKAISDMLQLSKKQEGIKSKTQNTDYNSTQFSELGEEQSQAEDAMASIANSMFELSEKSFAVSPEMGKQLGTALQQMQDAMSQLGQRNTQGALNSQSNAMSALNKAALEMQAQLSAMKSNGQCNNPGGMNPGGKGGTGAGGMMERLQQLAGQQQGINQGMQQMSMGGKLSQEQQAELGRIASQQGRAQKSLEELDKEQKQMGGPKLALGDLNKIAKEMEETVSDIQRGQITPETMKRQDRILSRLLDATKSFNERDYEKKRESKTGEQFSRKSPDALDLNSLEGKNKAMQELLKSIQQGYTKDYESLIRQYFEALQKSGQKIQ